MNKFFLCLILFAFSINVSAKSKIMMNVGKFEGFNKRQEKCTLDVNYHHYSGTFNIMTSITSSRRFEVSDIRPFQHGSREYHASNKDTNMYVTLFIDFLKRTPLKYVVFYRRSDQPNDVEILTICSFGTPQWPWSTRRD